MPLITIKDLTTPLTRKEVEGSIYQTLETLEVPTTSWKPGGVMRALTTAIALVIAALTVLIAAIARSSFLETAEGAWLTLVAKWVFGVERIRATYATGEVTLTNSAGGYWALEPGDLIFRNPATDKTYVNAEPVELLPMQPARVKIRAQEVGSESNANPGDITELVTTLNGVSCTNDASVIGFDEEGDEALRVRCREKPASLSPNGPPEAYRYWAKSAVKDGAPLGVTRVKVARISDFGEVMVTVARATGGLAPGELAFLKSFLEKTAVPHGVTMYLQNAPAKNIGLTCQVWVKSSRDDTSIRNAASARIDQLFRVIDIGGETLVDDGPGYVFRDAVIEAIRGALPGEIVRAVVSMPATDVELAGDEIPVRDIANTTVTITRVT